MRTLNRLAIDCIYVLSKEELSKENRVFVILPEMCQIKARTSQMNNFTNLLFLNKLYKLFG